MTFKRIVFSLLSLFIFSFCAQKSTDNTENTSSPPEKPLEPMVGAADFDAYIPSLENKNIALVVNQTSNVGNHHLVDTLLAKGVNIVKIFAPEHGFRGDGYRGETIESEVDDKTGLPLVSLYGKNKKPTETMLSNVDVVIFDIQDVGARFFTYISTMHKVMESCATFNKAFIVLDRPNPHGNYVDGPVLDPAFMSFIGMHKIPISHGLTVGELATMINEEGWLENSLKCDLTVVKCKNYTHDTPYELPMWPSPNLPDQTSVLFYPSLCLFEGTAISVGRGTKIPFQIIGYPDKKFGDYNFTPKSIVGMSKYPKHENIECWGINFQGEEMNLSIGLKYLIEFYDKFDKKDEFFLESFNLLAGTDQLKAQIQNGIDVNTIVESWQPKLNEFKALRKKYLVYPEKK